MGKLEDILPEDKILSFIKKVREIPTPSKDFSGLIHPSEASDYIFQVIVESSFKKFGINFSDQGTNIFLFDDKKFKHQADLVEKSEAYTKLNDHTKSIFSESDLEILGRVLYVSAMKYMRDNYPMYYKQILKGCILIPKKESPYREKDGSVRMKQITLGVLWNKKEQKHELYYNPIFIARGCIEEVFGELMELPPNTDFSKLDYTYIYDWLTVITCFYFLHELFHIIFDETKKFQEERLELSFIDPDAKNIINDFYINNQLEDIFSANGYIRRVYLDVLGGNKRKLTMKTGIADHFFFQGYPSTAIGVDIFDLNDSRSYATIGEDIVKIINENLSTRIGDNFTFDPAIMEKDEVRIATSEPYKVAMTANISDKSGKTIGIDNPKEFYNTCKGIVKYAFSKPPKAKSGTVSVSIDDEFEDVDVKPESAESIFQPIPEGSVVKINSTGEVGIVHTAKRNEDGTWTFTVHKANKTITEAREDRIPKGWEVTDEIVGDFSVDEIEVIELPPQRTGKKSKAEKDKQSQGQPPNPGSSGSQGDKQDSEDSDDGQGGGQGDDQGDEYSDSEGSSGQPSGKAPQGQEQDGEDSDSGGGSPSNQKDKTPKDPSKDSGDGQDGDGEKDLTISTDDKKKVEREREEADGTGEDSDNVGDGEGENGIKHDSDEERRKAREAIAELAKEVKKELNITSDVLDSTIDPNADIRKRVEEQAMSQWKKIIKKRIEKALGIEINYDLDAYNRRIKGVFGEEVIETTLEDICFSFDVSGSMNIRKNYGPVLEFMEAMFKMNGLKFKRAGMNYWAGESKCTKLFKTTGKKFVETAVALLGTVGQGITDGTNEEYSLTPFHPGESWSSAKPSLVIIFTDGQLFGELSDLSKRFIKGRYGRNIIVVVVPGRESADYEKPGKRYKLFDGEKSIVKVKSKN